MTQDGVNSTTVDVNDYLSEKGDEFFDVIGDVINKGEKIHISAPVGTGKTSLAMDLIEHLGSEYRTLFLFPIIALSEQFLHKFNERKINAEVFNSSVDIEEVKDSQVILSTIDSAYKLLDDGFLDDSKVLIILDETHTYLQKPRDDFHLSVDAMLSSGYPIIGLSATPSLWVNNYLFGIRNYIDVRVLNYEKKKVNPIRVEKGLIRFVADKVCANKSDKWVIFLERKSLQKKLKELIEQQRPKSKVIVLNADTKKGSEKKTWKRLMTKDKLPKSVDIAILNSVVQAGINIKNTDINHVILVDRHDPYGLMQFLGRCRNYTGEFDYYFSPGGIDLKYTPTSEDIQKRIRRISKLIYSIRADYHEDVKELIEPGGQIVIDKDGDLTVNKCQVANKVYSILRSIPGEELMELLPDDITVSKVAEKKGVTGSTSTQRKLNRDAERRKLVKKIEKNASMILGLEHCIKPDDTYETTLDLISKSRKQELLALSYEVPYLKDDKDRKKLRKIIKLAERADRSIQRVLLAARLYVKTGDKKVLKQYIKTGNPSIKNLSNAKHFFTEYIHNEFVQDVLDALKARIGDYMDATAWKNLIKNELPAFAREDNLDDLIYNSCLQFKNKDVMVKGKRRKLKELIGINKTFDDYLNHKGTLKEFITPTT